MYAHIYFLISKGELKVFTNVIFFLIFTVPGVVIGAQVGVMLSNIINHKSMGRFVGALFVVLAILTFLTILRESKNPTWLGRRRARMIKQKSDLGVASSIFTVFLT